MTRLQGIDPTTKRERVLHLAQYEGEGYSCLESSAESSRGDDFDGGFALSCWTREEIDRRVNLLLGATLPRLPRYLDQV